MLPTPWSPRRISTCPSATRDSARSAAAWDRPGFIVYDDTTCMVDAAYRFSRFLSIESCGQCPPCKLGSSAITEHLERIETGVGGDDDLDEIVRWLDHVTDGSRCYLATEEQIVVSSILRAFPEEFAEHIELGRCPRPRRLPIPKLVDLANGRATYDESFWRKQPDWTYAASRSDRRAAHRPVPR